MSFKSAFGNYNVNEELISTTVQGTSGTLPIFGTNGKISTTIPTPIDSNLYVKGGHHQYDTFTEITNIPDSHKKVGMEAHQNTNLEQESDYVASTTTNSVTTSNGKVFILTNGDIIHVVDPDTNTSIADIDATTAGAGNGGRYILKNTGDKIYVSSFDNTSIIEIDTIENKISRVLTLSTYNQINSGVLVGTNLYVAEAWLDNETLRVIDLISGTYTEVEDSSGSFSYLFDPASNLAYSPTQNKVYVFGGGGILGTGVVNKIWVINTINNRVEAEINTGILGINGPMYTGNNNTINVFVESTQKIWAVSRPSGIVFSIDTTTDTIVDQISLPFGSGPASIYLVGNKLYVSDFDGNSLHIIDLTTNTIIKTITGLGGAGGGIAQVAYYENRLFVPLWSGMGVAVINTITDNLLGIFPLSGQPRAAAYVPIFDKVYVVGSANVGVLSYEYAKTYVLQQDLTTWEETTPISKNGDYIKGILNYSGDLSTAMTDSSIPDISYVKSLISSLEETQQFVTTDATADVQNRTIIYEGTGGHTIDLFSASYQIGKRLVIKNSASSTGTGIIIDGDGSDTIDGNLTVTITIGNFIHIESDGSKWHIIG
jgi:YVTN family beta-propeller protein